MIPSFVTSLTKYLTSFLVMISPTSIFTWLLIVSLTISLSVEIFLLINSISVVDKVYYIDAFNKEKLLMSNGEIQASLKFVKDNFNLVNEHYVIIYVHINNGDLWKIIVYG